MAALLFIRHCATAGQGPDSPLTEKGQADALALAAPLKALGIDAVFSSPYARAVASVAPAAAAAGLDLRIDGRLRERACAWFDRIEDFQTHAARGLADRAYKLDGEESIAETAARMLAASADIAAAGHRLPAIACHGQALTALFSHGDPSFDAQRWRRMRNPHVFLTEWTGDAVQIRRELDLLR